MKTKATWIWYPGDFEVWLGNIFNNRRTERGAVFPPFWKQDSHYITVEFSKAFTLDQEEKITIVAEGLFNLQIDGKLQALKYMSLSEARQSYNDCDDTLSDRLKVVKVTIPAGEHKLNIKVWNQQTPPAIYINGKTIKTDSSWLVTNEDKLWIDENGLAHGSGIYKPAASWNFDKAGAPPTTYELSAKRLDPVSVECILGGGKLYDFGKETFGYISTEDIDPDAKINFYYGESREEALDKEHCETLDVFPSGFFFDFYRTFGYLTLGESKAFRYVYIEADRENAYEGVYMLYEYVKHDPQKSGKFRCSDKKLNRIWNVAAYTMDLTNREFFMDGIKRDRWTWSGDAIQSYLMNYYLRFDNECVKRTIRQLRGKDPVTAHVNTIMDYTFYWFKSILDYYQYTGDVAFVHEMWPRMVSLMEYVLDRVNEDQLAEGQEDDWIFVDWVDFPMHKRGSLCFEQILFYKALETMATCARLLAKEPKVDYNEGPEHRDYQVKADFYEMMAEDLRKKIDEYFWNDDAKAYLHALEDGQLNTQITKFPNMFAILYGLTDAQQQQDIMQSVMLNKQIDPITTPYMRFYELETLCMAGLQQEVLQEIRAYWGGMLKEGATTFWEKYVPTEKGAEHLAMYGRPYGKSLCHAWGASPVYLLGKYFLGVQPTKPGYQEYEVRPALGDLEWMEGAVPTPFGLVHVRMDEHQVKVKGCQSEGWLIVSDQKVHIAPGEEVVITY